MTRRPEPREMPPMTDAQRRDNWWRYHWLYVLVGVLAATAVAGVVWERVTRERYDCSVALVTKYAASPTEIASIQTALEAVCPDLAGPQLCGLADTILRALRDEPGFWWYTYRRAWKRNAKDALLPGAVGGLLLSTQMFLLFHAGALGLRTAAGAGLIAGVLLVLAISLYLWPQLALMELPFLRLVKNALLLFLGQLPRSIGALALLAGYLGIMTRFFTLAVTILPLTNLWVPIFPALFLIYPGIDQNFRIEEQLRGR